MRGNGINYFTEADFFYLTDNRLCEIDLLFNFVTTC